MNLDFVVAQTQIQSNLIITNLRATNVITVIIHVINCYFGPKKAIILIRNIRELVIADGLAQN